MPKYKCLIVEDSPMMRQLLCFAIGRIREITQIDEADNGLDGIKKISNGVYDLVIVDINMPVMDGLKLIKRVRNDANHRDVPIIIVTTEGTSEDRQRAEALGVNAYITKPITAPNVIEKIKQILKLED